MPDRSRPLPGALRVRVCIVYDCLFPWTIGGAERWYRQLAEAHAARGDAVTYLTLRQWDADAAPAIAGVEVVAAGPRMDLYRDGKRRVLPPLVFGLGVLWHLLRRGRRYDVVAAASFPFFSLLAAALAKPFASYRIAADWHEVWTREYWREYLGALGVIGWAVQKLCAVVPQVPFAFSRLHAGRVEALGTGPVTVLEGEYAGTGHPAVTAAEPRFVLYAGRMIPEKRTGLLVAALIRLMREDADLRAVLVGRGPELEAVRAEVQAAALEERIALPGFVAGEVLEDWQRTAAVLVQPSAREGYGMVVVESAARGVPVVLVPGADNAASELMEPGENGFIAEDATPEALAEAIRRALAGGDGLRQRAAGWYGRNAARLSFARSFEQRGARLAADRGRT